MVIISAENIIKYFSYFFFQKTGFGISCKLSPKETTLSEMAKPIFWRKKKCETIFMKCKKPMFWEKRRKEKTKTFINLPSAEFSHRALKVKIDSAIVTSRSYTSIRVYLL